MLWTGKAAPEEAETGAQPQASSFWSLAGVGDGGLAAGLIGLPVTEPPAAPLFIVGGLGPVLVAVLLVLRNYSLEQRHEFWRRIWDLRRVGSPWWLITLAAGAGPTVIGWLLFPDGGLVIDISATAAAEVGVVTWLLFAAGAALVEEPGWRGYALDALLGRHNLLTASSLLGVLWAAWHLPQFFLEGTYQESEVGFATGAFWMFIGAIVAQAFLYAWIVIHTQGSILAAIVFHASTNLAGELLDPGTSARLVALILWVAAAAVVAPRMRTGPQEHPA